MKKILVKVWGNWPSAVRVHDAVGHSLNKEILCRAGAHLIDPVDDYCDTCEKLRADLDLVGVLPRREIEE